MRNGDLLHDENLTSHEDLLRLFNIKDSQVNQDKFVRAEFTPDDKNDFPDIEKYKLNVDEKSIPEWFEKHREYITSRLKEIVSKRIITTDQKILTGGLYVIKNCVIDKLINARVIYLHGHINTMGKDSQVDRMWENSRVNIMRENSWVIEMNENSQVNIMKENSEVDIMRNNSRVDTMEDYSRVGIHNSNNPLPIK